MNEDFYHYELLTQSQQQRAFQYAEILILADTSNADDPTCKNSIPQKQFNSNQHAIRDRTHSFILPTKGKYCHLSRFNAIFIMILNLSD